MVGQGSSTKCSEQKGEVGPSVYCLSSAAALLGCAFLSFPEHVELGLWCLPWLTCTSNKGVNIKNISARPLDLVQLTINFAPFASFLFIQTIFLIHLLFVDDQSDSQWLHFRYPPETGVFTPPPKLSSSWEAQVEEPDSDHFHWNSQSLCLRLPVTQSSSTASRP